MQIMIKLLITAVISAGMQMGIINAVSQEPIDTVNDFLDGMKSRDTHVMERYMDNSYVNFISNAQGDEKVIERMNDAIFSRFSYKVEDIKQKNDVAVAKVIVKSGDFSKVLDEYDEESYEYITDNLYEEEVKDKEKLDAVCLEIYVKQIEKASKSDKRLETVVFIPMVDNGYYGWNVIVTDEFMKAILGNLKTP